MPDNTFRKDKKKKAKKGHIQSLPHNLETAVLHMQVNSVNLLFLRFKCPSASGRASNDYSINSLSLENLSTYQNKVVDGIFNKSNHLL